MNKNCASKHQNNLRHRIYESISVWPKHAKAEGLKDVFLWEGQFGGLKIYQAASRPPSNKVHESWLASCRLASFSHRTSDFPRTATALTPYHTDCSKAGSVSAGMSTRLCKTSLTWGWCAWTRAIPHQWGQSQRGVLGFEYNKNIYKHWKPIYHLNCLLSKHPQRHSTQKNCWSW